MEKDAALWLMAAGVILLGIGVLAYSGLLGWFGRLPGDIRIEREGFRFYFPIVTMLVLSALFSVIVYIVRKL